ncbi:MAG: hypothetical protein ACRDBG_27220, partial [Waterburya sp.]
NMTVKEQEQEYLNLYSETIDSLEEAYTNEEISEEELIGLKTQTLAELELALAELRGLTEDDLNEFTEDETEEQKYSMNTNYANFSTASAYLVPAVMDLIDSHYEDREEAFSDMMEVTGINEKELEGFLTGQLEASPEFIDIISGMFEETATDSDAALGLQLMGALDRGDTTEEELEESEYEEDDYEDYEELDEEGEVEPETNYSAVDPRVRELEFKMAEIERNSALKQKLNSIAEFAKQGLEERWLSRAMYDLLLGSFEKDEDRVAAFSQTADANNVDLATQLYAVLFTLKANEECGERINFSSYVQEDVVSSNSPDDELALLQVEKLKENPAFKRFK